MAEEIISTPPAEGDHVEIDGQQAAAPEPQGSGQGQNAGSGSVGNQTPNASGNQGQERPQQNFTRAQQRVLEKTLDRIISQRLQPFTERFDQFTRPPAPASQPQANEPIDWNDFDGWLQRKLNSTLDQRFSKFETEKLPAFKGEIDSGLKRREAENYLISHPDIGNNDDKLEEINGILDKYMLRPAMRENPVEALKVAVSIWKEKRVNPNAPPRNTLTTVTGGAGRTGVNKTPAYDRQIALQKIVASNLPQAEKQKAIDEINLMMTAA